MTTPAERFGPFLVLKTLGRGGMGEVFLARTPWPEAPLAAVKRLRPDVARVPTFAERFKHEALLAARLEHPNLVKTLDVGSVGEQLYVAAELVLGKDAGVIADRLRERGQGGPAAVALRLLVDGLLGLAYVHGACNADGTPLGLIHRDVTPGNLLIGYDGRVVLADFGLAKSFLSAASRLTKQGEILGTPHYLAPEVVEGRPAGTGSDIYGLGAVLYRFLTGVAPYTGSTSDVLMKVLTERPRPLAELRPDLPGWCVQLVEQLLQPNPSRRPADAKRLADAVEARARSENLWVPSAAVGRWLSELFSDVHAAEVDEIGALRQASGTLPLAGTMVLVPTVDGEAPPPLEPHFPEPPGLLASGVADEDDDRRGTLLDGLGASRPPSTDATEAPTRAHPSPNPDPAVGNAPHRPDETLPTPAPRQPTPTQPRPGLPEVQRRIPDGPTPDEDGFDASSATALEPLPELDPTGGAEPHSHPALVTPVAEGDDGPFRLRPTGLDGGLPPLRRSRRPSPLFLVGLLALAIATGIALGRAVAWLKAPTTVEPAEPSRLAARLDRWARRLERRETGGEPVPAAAWRALARANQAARVGSREACERYLAELESIPLDTAPSD